MACMLSVPAQAQSTNQSSTQAPSNNAPVQLAPIAVEGKADKGYKVDKSASDKFTAPLVDTPKSVTVIPKEIIEERNATSLEDVLRTTPGITLGAGEGGTPSADRPNIRGFSSEGNIFVDGMRDTGSQTRDTFNLDQVEVIKGPGSAYSGRGSTGGSLNLVTKKASLEEDFFEGTVSVGLPLSKRATGDANYMLSEKAAVRLNVLVEDSEVAGRDEVTTSSFGFAPSMALKLTDDTKATLSLYHLQTDDMPDYGHPYDPATGEPATVDRDNFYGLTNRDFQETQVDSATFDFEHDLNNSLTLRNVTRYSWSENDYIVTNPNDSAADNISEGSVWRAVKSRNSDTTVLSNQTDLSGDFETFNLKHSFNTGIEISYETSRNRNYSVDTGNRDCSAGGVGAAGGFNCTSLASPNPNDPWSGSIAPSTRSTKTTVNTRSIYAFDTIELDPQWLVNFGLRLDDYETTSGANRNQATFLNYQLGAVYKPSTNGSIYASFGTSSEPPGSTAGEGGDNISASNADLEPEDSRSYEIGTKWDLFDEKLAVTGALFRTEKTNARVSTAPGRGALQALGGEQVVNGAEIGVSGDITDTWHVFGGYTFMDSKIVDDGPISTDEGNRIPNVPAHSLSIWSTYDVTPDLNLGGGATYVAKRYANTANDKKVPAYWLFDAVATYTIQENIDLRLNVNNVFDTTYYVKPFVTHFATVGTGRSAVLSTSFKF
jgi:catecholate siderophore receptor